MFNKKGIKILAIIEITAAILCTLWNYFVLTNFSGWAIAGLISCFFYLCSGYLGLKLSKYDLQSDEYKTIGKRLIIATCLCFANIFFGVMFSFVVSIIVFGTFYSLKSNYDEWEEKKKERAAKMK